MGIALAKSTGQAKFACGCAALRLPQELRGSRVSVGATSCGAMLDRTQESSLGRLKRAPSGGCVVRGCLGNFGAVRGDRVHFRLRSVVYVRTELSCLGMNRRTACFRVSSSGRGAVARATAGSSIGLLSRWQWTAAICSLCPTQWTRENWETWADHPRRSASFPSCLMIALVRVVVACTSRRVGRISGVWCSGGASALSACTRLGAGSLSLAQCRVAGR